MPEARTPARHRGVRNPKKSRRVLCEGTAVRYEFIRRPHRQFRIAALCRVLRVSRSGFYEWRQRVPSPRVQANEHLLADIRRVHWEHREAYGALKTWRALNRQGVARSRGRSEEHTSELQSQSNLVCRLLLEKKKIERRIRITNM